MLRIVPYGPAAFVEFEGTRRHEVGSEGMVLGSEWQVEVTTEILRTS